MFNALQYFAVGFALLYFVNATLNNQNTISFMNNIFCNKERTTLLLVAGCIYTLSKEYQWDMLPVVAIAELAAVVILLHGMFKDNGLFGLLRK